MNSGEFSVHLALTVGNFFPPARDDVQSGCHQFGCGGGAQVWGKIQHLYNPEKRVLEVAGSPGRLRTEVYVYSPTVWSNTVRLQGSENTTFVCVLQSTAGLKRKWRSTRKDTVEENFRASSTTRPLSRWSRSRSSSWRNQQSRDSRMSEVFVESLMD